MTRQGSYWLYIIAIIFLLTGCRVNPDYDPILDNPPIFLPTHTPQGPPPTPSPGSHMFLEDDFSDSSSGWEIGNFSGGTVGYVDGVYRVTSIGNGTLMWGVAGENFQNVLIEVTAIQQDRSENGESAYGVICNINGEGSAISGYGLVISRAGLFSIIRLTEGEIYPLVNWTPTGAINTGIGEPGRFQIVCSNGMLRLFFNGSLLTEVRDGEYFSGDIALLVVALDENPVEVDFDDIRITGE